MQKFKQEFESLEKEKEGKRGRQEECKKRYTELSTFMKGRQWKKNLPLGLRFILGAERQEGQREEEGEMGGGGHFSPGTVPHRKE